MDLAERHSCSYTTIQRYMQILQIIDKQYYISRDKCKFIGVLISNDFVWIFMRYKQRLCAFI